MRLNYLLVLALIAALAVSKPLEDSCECECCYEAEQGRIECIRKATTTFQARTCSDCNVTACVQRFPDQCGLKGASVEADCIERTAWYLRFIPVFFLIATIALLFYGFFIKTFDGYHPIPGPSYSLDEGSVTRVFSAGPYANAEHSPFEPRQPYAVRRPSPLSQTVPLSSAGLADFAAPMSRKTVTRGEGPMRKMESVPLPMQGPNYGGVRVTEPVSPADTEGIELSPKNATEIQWDKLPDAPSGTGVRIGETSEQVRNDLAPESEVRVFTPDAFVDAKNGTIKLGNDDVP